MIWGISQSNSTPDLQHHVWLVTLHGELALSPKGRFGAKRVLDAGTGTGIWAIDYGKTSSDAYSETSRAVSTGSLG